MVPEHCQVRLNVYKALINADGLTVQQSGENFFKTIDALTPPKPKELDMAN